ncbi:hypothetical protein GYMLUDRAFT_253301 [Collybiopsis luxurians FD-317 M1]|uniref:Uncharacterized protein n=1 Tax=Collybiopsis luxurians FD-317 M1 TaxID=944289 RepID=A0A0D0BX58_9AGAR|nr:hypothetical protein GYMLUDRAFT_253301 [Collybiopsis luxurians FD-317 M1]
MASDSVPAFFIDWTKYPNMARVKCCVAFKYIVPSTTSALEPKLQPTRSGNAKIQVSKKFRTKIRYVATVAYSKKDRSFEEAEWSRKSLTLRTMKMTKPAFDSDLVLLHQHTGVRIDSDKEVDPNPQDAGLPNPQPTRQPAPCLPVAINSALAPTVKPYANQLILTHAPLPALLNLAESSYCCSPSPSRQLINLWTWTSAMMVMMSKH